MRFSLIPIIPVLLLASCGSSPDEKEAEDEKKLNAPTKRVVGRIASVSKVGQFVLIQKFGAGSLAKNVIYQSQGPDGKTASLRPSGERLRDFFAADLVSGTAKKGDAVVAYNLPAKDEPKPNESDKKTPTEPEPDLPKTPTKAPQTDDQDTETIKKVQ